MKGRGRAFGRAVLVSAAIAFGICLLTWLGAVVFSHLDPGAALLPIAFWFAVLFVSGLFGLRRTYSRPDRLE